MTKIRIITYNLQKLQLNSLATFLTSIQKNKYHAISITEYDAKSSETSINQVLFTHDYVLAHVSTNQRTAFFVQADIPVHNYGYHNNLVTQNPHTHHYIDDITILIDNLEITLVSVYTPVYNSNNQNPYHAINKAAFIQDFSELIPHYLRFNPNIIFMGDWNTKSLTDTSNSPIENFLHQTMSSFLLTDIFYLPCNKRKQKYTNVSYATNNRLDRFYASQGIMKKYLINYRLLRKLQFSTHHPVSITLAVSSKNSPPMLPARDYTRKLSAIPRSIQDSSSMMSFLFSPTPLWADNPSLSYDAYISRIHMRKKLLSKTLSHLPGFNFANATTEQEMSELTPAASENFRLLRSRFNRSGQPTIFADNTIKESNAFYDSLFSEQTQHMNHHEELQSFLKCFPEKLTEEEQDSLTTPLKSEELEKNLSKLVSDGPSAPGWDQITYLQWKQNWKHAKDHILHLGNAILNGHVNKNDAFAKVLIKLIPKKSFNKETPKIDDLRPISLTNTIFRLINYTITQRIMPIANRIILYNQQAFLWNRNIHFNIEVAKIVAQDIENRMPSTHQHMFMIDLRKAFDTLNHSYIEQLFTHLGFPPIFTKSILLQSSLSYAQILNGNMISNHRIELKRGVRQGLPFSPVIFNIAIEPLLRKLQSSLEGIKYTPSPRTHLTNQPLTLQTRIKTLAFADDILLFNNDTHDLEKGLSIIEIFSHFSHLQLNPTKSTAYANERSIESLHDFSTRTGNTFQVLSFSENPSYLGVRLIRTNWESLIENLKQRLRKITFMDLNLYQRVIAVNTYIYSTIYFQDQHDPVPIDLLKDFEKFTKNAIQSFLPHKIPKSRIYWHHPHSKGGMGLLDLGKQLQGRRAYYIHLITERDNKLHFISQHPLSQILRTLAQAVTDTFIRNAYAFTNISSQIHSMLRDSSRIPSIEEMFENGIPGNMNHNRITTVHYEDILNPDKLFKDNRRMKSHIKDIKAVFKPFDILINLQPPENNSLEANELQSTNPSTTLTVTLPPVADYHNFSAYLEAWYGMVTCKANTGRIRPKPLSFMTYSRNTRHYTGKNGIFLERWKPNKAVTSESFRQHSKKTTKNLALSDTISYWTKHMTLTEPQWSKLLKRISSLHNQHHTLFNEVFELHVGLLNKAFVPPCVFCNDPTTGGPRHTFLHCKGVIDFIKAVNYNSIHPRDCIGKILSTGGFIKANRLIRLIVYVARKLKRIQLEQHIAPDNSYWPAVYHQFQFENTLNTN